MVAVLNVVGVDWATFGNHEFDIPEAAFRARLARIEVPHRVASNVTDASGAPVPERAARAVVPVERRRDRPRRFDRADDRLNKQPWVRYARRVDAARAAVAALKGRADVIVALTHLTLAGDRSSPSRCPEIDLDPRRPRARELDLRARTQLHPDRESGRQRSHGRGRVAPVPAKGARLRSLTHGLERIDDRLKEGPRTSAEVRKWTDLGSPRFRAAGFDPDDSRRAATESRSRAARPRCERPDHADRTDHRPRCGKEAGAPIAIFNSGCIRIDDVAAARPVTQYDVIRVLPLRRQDRESDLHRRAALAKVLQIGEQNIGTGGYPPHRRVRRTIDPAARYTLAISDFLLTGGEANLGFLTRMNSEVSDISEFRDIRMAVIDELKLKRK